MKDRLSKVARRAGLGGMRGLAQRVAELEDEVQENRRLNRRVAELLDVVEELLVPLAQRDEDKVRAYLRAHGAELDGPDLDAPGAE